MTVVTAVVGFVGLVLASALFVAAELAFVATGRTGWRSVHTPATVVRRTRLAVQRACSCSAGTQATVTAGVFEVSAMDGYRITELALRPRRRPPA